MNTLKSKRTYMDLIFVLALFVLFAVSSSSLIILGARIYQNTLDQMDVHFDDRIAASYVIEKIHQNDQFDAVHIKNISDHSVLCLSQTIQDISYTTYIYTYDQQLYELFTRSDLEFDFTYGTRILDLEEITFERETPQVIKITFKHDLDHSTYHCYVNLFSTQTTDF